MTEYIIELVPKDPIIILKVQANSKLQAEAIGEQLAEDRGMIFKQSYKYNKTDVFDKVIHTVENLKEF